MTAPGVVSALIGTAAENKIRDLELRLNVVRQQRDEAVQQLLDERATVAVLRRKLDQRADGIGYCDSTFTAPDGASYVCALDAGHRANLHRDASLRYAWDDNAKPPVVEHNEPDACADIEQCDECETVGQNCRAHAVADAHGIEHNDMRDECGAEGRDGPCTRDEGHEGAHTNDVAIWMAGAQCAQLSPDELRAAVQEMRGSQ
ncbi:hypothetical protein SEA_PINKCOFFEE_67 [Gordonia phage PinkCoffee]|nr:hypothetical protein SEA_PINKCOFFEE_67 [Gordonia phage PinkCoffee]